MSRSTFSGPVIVGVDSSPTRLQTPDRVEGSPNWGFVNMAQSAPITQSTDITYPTSTTAMTMVIPGNSTITRISLLVTTAWTTVFSVDIGQTWTGIGTGDANDLVQALPTNDLGMTVVGPGDTDNLAAGDINNWMNNSSTESPYDGDRCIIVQSPASAGSGVGILTVEYCQAVDLSAIA